MQGGCCEEGVQVGGCFFADGGGEPVGFYGVDGRVLLLLLFGVVVLGVVLLVGWVVVVLALAAFELERFGLRGWWGEWGALVWCGCVGGFGRWGGRC